MKNPLRLAGIEPATFQILAQRLNHKFRESKIITSCTMCGSVAANCTDSEINASNVRIEIR